MEQTESQKPQAELNDSVDMWRRKVEELERTLAMKEEEISTAMETYKSKTVFHMETTLELSIKQVALNNSEKKCAALEESLNKKVQEKEENQQMQLKEKEEIMKKMMAQEDERESNEWQEKLDREIQKREEAVRQELFLMEEKFAKEQNERILQHQKEILKKEELLEQQLRDQKNGFNKQLTDMLRQWTGRAVEMDRKEKELEQQLHENIRSREQEQDNTKEKIQRLSEEVSHLLVRSFNLCSYFKKC